MKILLIDPPLKNVDNKFSVVHKEIIYPSLGLYYLREYSKKNIQNIDIKILNLTLDDFDKSIDLVISEKPNLIGLSCFTDRRSIVFEFVNAIKKKNEFIKIVLGGSHASLYYEYILKTHNVDFVVTGEGEITFKELLDNLKKETYENIKGLAYKKNGEVIYNGPRNFIQNLDELPYPEFNEEETSIIKFLHYDGRYKFKGKDISQLKQMSVITSRGCPFKCVYCSTMSYWGRKVRFRTAENVYNEIEYLNKKHKVEFINFIDDAFTIDKNRIIKLCDLIIKNNLEICWICETNVKTINYEMLEKMKQAGCFAINYGVESGALSILNNIHKNVTPAEIINAVKMTKKLDMIADIFLMVGNPGENHKTIYQTLKILKIANPDSGGWGILTIFPGTELYRNCLSEKYISDKYWESEKSSPYYLKENSYIKLRIFLNKIRCFFLFKQKKYKLWFRYKLLEIRDYIFEYTGIYITKRKIKIDLKSEFRKSNLKYF